MQFTDHTSFDCLQVLISNNYLYIKEIKKMTKIAIAFVVLVIVLYVSIYKNLTTRHKNNYFFFYLR